MQFNSMHSERYLSIARRATAKMCVYIGIGLIILGSFLGRILLRVTPPYVPLYRGICRFAQSIIKLDCERWLSILGALGYIVAFAGTGAVVFGYLYSSKIAARIAEVDSRPPILFLRRFSQDKVSILKRLLQVFGSLEANLFTPEELLRDEFQSFGPFVALGKSGEKIPPPGAARKYVNDAVWRDVVKSLIDRAQLVIIQAGASESLLWEITRVINTVAPQQVILLVPKGRKCKERQYKQFYTLINELLPSPLPENFGKAQFIWFDPSGNPLLLEQPHIPMTIYFREFLKSLVGPMTKIHMTLAPVREYLAFRNASDASPRVISDSDPSR
jgi:hypothetical protein